MEQLLKTTATLQTTPGEFNPSVEWTSSDTTHTLRIHLPGFKKEDLKVVVDSSGKLTVRGKRMIPEPNYVRLDQSFEVPKDSDIDKITGKYEHDYLTVVMPRKTIERHSSWSSVPFDEKKWVEDPISKGKKGGGEKVADRKKRTEGKDESQAFERGLMDNLLEKINNNKKVFAVAVAAFAVGFYVGQGHRSTTI